MSHWNNVELKLPDALGSYLVWEYNCAYVRVYNVECNCWDDEDGDDFYTRAVGGGITHWAEIPEPPNEKEN